MNKNRFLALGGIAGPLLFTSMVIVIGQLRSDYNHMTRFISELGETGGQYSAVMNLLGFMCGATMIMLFAVSLRSRFRPTALNALASLLIGIYATGMFLAGVFSCDIGCTPAVPTTEQRLHALVSFVAFASLITGVFLWGVYLRNNQAWRWFGNYSLATAGLAMVLLFAMISTAATRSGSGLFQRLFSGHAVFVDDFFRSSDLARRPRI